MYPTAGYRFYGAYLSALTLRIAFMVPSLLTLTLRMASMVRNLSPNDVYRFDGGALS